MWSFTGSLPSRKYGGGKDEEMGAGGLHGRWVREQMGWAMGDREMEGERSDKRGVGERGYLIFVLSAPALTVCSSRNNVTLKHTKKESLYDAMFDLCDALIYRFRSGFRMAFQWCPCIKATEQDKRNLSHPSPLQNLQRDQTSNLQMSTGTHTTNDKTSFTV